MKTGRPQVILDTNALFAFIDGEPAVGALALHALFLTHAKGTKDYQTAEGIRLASAMTLLKTLI